MKYILKLSLIIVMVFTLSLTVDQSYAYWSTVDSANTDVTGTVTLGTWVAPWDPNVTYNTGDLVYYNGTVWVSLKTSNSGKEPSLSKPNSNWWTPQ